MNNEPLPIPVTILAGFLGAGKTTLLNHMLQSLPARRIAVIQNDFGSVDTITSEQNSTAHTVEVLAHGCVCCSLRSRLYTTLSRLVHTPRPPQHIIIEASALAEPGAIAQLFLDPQLRRSMVLDAIFTVLDARQSRRMTGDLAQLTRVQVRAADIIVLNKVDLVNAAGLRAARTWLATLDVTAPIIESVYGRIPPDIFFTDAVATEASASPGRAPANAVSRPPHIPNGSPLATVPSPAIVRWTYTSDVPLHLARLQAVLAGLLPSSLYRVKGVLYLTEETRTRTLLQIVGRRTTITDGGGWDETPHTRLAFTGACCGVEIDELQNQLDDCRVATQSPRS